MASVAPILLRRPRSWSWVRALRGMPSPVRAGFAAAAGLVVGGATSFLQGALPFALSSAANSATGWTLVTVLVVALLRDRPAWSAASATACFLALTLGYQLVSTARGFPTSETFFLIAGLVVGPFVGVATAWLRKRGARPALAAALLGGIGVGEGGYGLAVVGDSTSPVYWTLIGLSGVALVAVVAVRRAERRWQGVLAVAGAALVAAAFLAAYSGGNVVAALLP